MLYKVGCTCLLLLVVLVSGCTVENTDPVEPPPVSAPGEEAAAVDTGLFTTAGGVSMAFIPAGSFTMGSDKGLEDEQPVHPVNISAFYMDIYEVTQENYEGLMGSNPAKYKNPTHPVEQLGWYGAIKYCNMRSLKEGLTPCYDLDTMTCDYDADGYRLPTEAEWEYACRAGTETAYSFGDRESDMGAAGWFEDNAAETTHPVGEKKPNPWGLYDMHGNVQEWCNDTYSETYYAESGDTDPCNFTAGEERVLRGGSWADAVDSCRSAARYSEAPGLADVCFGYDAYGFRCVRRINSEAATE